ncbi:MAG: sodium:solute symporter [Chitinophagaceae bacterium]|nr:sodium:solute symporter [Chitinophagaceae bacterium]MBK7680322.1 sodium:solute symporter [Chitinophagaceae bacterium]MBK8301754.1 sodium:solute symporter [Chitinophagaceae bacterium]MBK9466312.1 sodium:solute symporter [Chitinophagaceae bacterium]MBK9938780.1 sodium:solute symporter [Chitinophagaceae bacterium]
MNQLDWIVLVVTLLGIITYGLYKSRTSHNLDGYFLSNRSLPWGLVLLSIMGTQASAITFLSAPGQAYTDGMRFVQYYFGIPLAMIVICIFFVPIFSRLKVYTAYEYLENRFDNKTRTLTSFLFLLQRGLSTGISVFAPSIILSSLFGWNIYYTNILMGGLLIIYTMSGGAKAVAYTQQLQLIIIFIGMFLAAYMVVNMLPQNVSFTDALNVSGKLGKLNVITTGFEKGHFNWSDQYNLFSGLIGGFFLALSYFGTDQSQVGRYLTARSLKQSRMGLLMNGLVKVPMQFLILLIGALVFTFYQFNKAPIFFNEVQVKKLQNSAVYKDSFLMVQQQYDAILIKKQQAVINYSAAADNNEKILQEKHISELQNLQDTANVLRGKVKDWLKTKEVGGDNNDTNYIFLRFVVDNLPVGLVGLLIAIIFLASWGSIAAAINSLASCTMIDFHRRFSKKKESGEDEYRISKWYTLAWGVFCIIVAMFTYNIGNSLIEAVNVLGSLFYGVILGVFLVAFFLKKIKNGHVVFWAAVLAELLVLTVFILTKTGVFKMGFLWLNPIGAFGVIFFSLILNTVLTKKNSPQ